MTEPQDPRDAAHMGFMDHLGELRTRIVRIAWILFAGFGVCWGFSEHIFAYLRAPILRFLPAGQTGLHYIGVLEKFMAHVKVSFLAAVLLTSPLWLYQVWRFIAPALYSKEKRYAGSFILAGIVFFLAGAGFAYYLALPAAFKFLLSFGGDADKPIITITEYLDFIFKFVLAFGMTFEMPVVLTFLGLMGIIDAAFLRKYRRWAIMIMAVLSAIVTPPDAVSMLALLVPLIFLYEMSIFVVAAVAKPRAA
jgi:sec-independent protein translocase protein TatC